MRRRRTSLGLCPLVLSLVFGLVCGPPAMAADPGQGPLPPGSVTAAVEPVLEHAEGDLRALRRARTAATLAVMAPAANHVSHLAMAPLLESREAGETDAAAAFVGTAGVMGVSTAGMLVLPTALDLHAQASRRRIQAQGGTVRKVSLPVLTACVSVLPVVLRGVPEAGEDAPEWRLALAYGAYGLSLVAPLNQLVHNRRARARAGWVPR